MCLVDSYNDVIDIFQDVLENDQIKLDHMFKFSLIQDIVRVRTVVHCMRVQTDVFC